MLSGLDLMPVIHAMKEWPIREARRQIVSEQNGAGVVTSSQPVISLVVRQPSRLTSPRDLRRVAAELPSTDQTATRSTRPDPLVAA